MLKRIAFDRFSVLHRDNEWLLGMALSSEAAALLEDERSAGVLYEELRPFAGQHAVGQPEGSMGAVDRYLGLLAAAAGQVDEAIGHLKDAERLERADGRLAMGDPDTSRSRSRAAETGSRG